LLEKLSRHEQYHAAIDELALAQSELMRAALDYGRRELPSDVIEQALRALSDWSGAPAAQLDQVGPEHGPWCTDVLSTMASLAPDGQRASEFRDLADLADAAGRSCRPRVRECSIVGMTSALRRGAERLRLVARLAGKRQSARRPDAVER
jgi:hypothetical protein